MRLSAALKKKPVKLERVAGLPADEGEVSLVEVMRELSAVRRLVSELSIGQATVIELKEACREMHEKADWLREEMNELVGLQDEVYKLAEEFKAERALRKESAKEEEGTEQAAQSGRAIDRALKKVLRAVEQAAAEVEQEAQGQESEVGK